MILWVADTCQLDVKHLDKDKDVYVGFLKFLPPDNWIKLRQIFY
jgi:hypothetical protein